jgi:hypothetical protein
VVDAQYRFRQSSVNGLSKVDANIGQPPLPRLALRAITMIKLRHPWAALLHLYLALEVDDEQL